MAYYFTRSNDLPWNMRRKRGEKTIQYRSCLPSGIIDHPSASVLRFYRKSSKKNTTILQCQQLTKQKTRYNNWRQTNKRKKISNKDTNKTEENTPNQATEQLHWE